MRSLQKAAWVAVAMVMFGCSGLGGAAGVMDTVAMERFVERHPTGLQIVDVRTTDEWVTGRIPGAVHVPLADLSADHPAIAALDKHQPVYFVCAVGGRSKQAAEKMAAEGFTALSVDGGTKGWEAAGQPLEGRP
jgi:thioredoxin 1